MKAYFIFNKYLENDKFKCLKNSFSEEAKALNIDIEFVSNSKSWQLVLEDKFDKRDFVLFWDKDVKLAKVLEDSAHKVINSSNAIEICDDKSKTFISLLNHKIRQPLTIVSPLIFYGSLASDIDFIDSAINKIGFPMIVKECFGSFGEQVYLINDKEELISKIDKIGIKPFIIQEFIKSSFGKDLRLYVVGDKVLASMKRENSRGDFRANIEIGGTGSLYNANDKQVEMAIKVSKEIGLEFGGIDLLFGENDEPIFCEANSNAYFNEMNRVANIRIEHHILKHIMSLA